MLGRQTFGLSPPGTSQVGDAMPYPAPQPRGPAPKAAPKHGPGAHPKRCSQPRGPPSLTIFSAAVLLMKRDPCPGLPTHFTLIPAATGDEGEALSRSPGCTRHPNAKTPSRAREGAVGRWVLTPGALFSVEDAEGVRGAGQAWGGHREVSEAGTAGGTAWGGPGGPQRLGEGVMPTRRGCQVRKDPLGGPTLPPLTLVQGKAHVERSELRALHEHLHALVSAHLLVCREKFAGEKGVPQPGTPAPSFPTGCPQSWPPPISPERGESKIPAGRRTSPR